MTGVKVCMDLRLVGTINLVQMTSSCVVKKPRCVTIRAQSRQ